MLQMHFRSGQSAIQLTNGPSAPEIVAASTGRPTSKPYLLLAAEQATALADNRRSKSGRTVPVNIKTRYNWIMRVMCSKKITSRSGPTRQGQNILSLTISKEGARFKICERLH